MSIAIGKPSCKPYYKTLYFLSVRCYFDNPCGASLIEYLGWTCGHTPRLLIGRPSLWLFPFAIKFFSCVRRGGKTIVSYMCKVPNMTFVGLEPIYRWWKDLWGACVNYGPHICRFYGLLQVVYWTLDHSLVCSVYMPWPHIFLGRL